MGWTTTDAVLLVALLVAASPLVSRMTVMGDIIFPGAKPCIPAGGGKGQCVPIADCPPVLQTYRDQPPVTCGFQGSTPIVCCPQDNGTILEPILDISPPPGYNDLECGRSAIKVFNTFGPSHPVLSDRLASDFVIAEEGSLLDSLKPLRGRVTGSRRNDGITLARKKRSSPRLEPALPPDIHRPVSQGETSRRNAWPWVALLGKKDRLGITWFCGGVLINEEWVLSALHCFQDFNADVVRLGEHDYNDDGDGATHQDFDVAELVLYPDYTHPEAYHDLALLRLASKVTLQRFILPVCLPWGKKSEENLENKATTIVGWGNTLYGGSPSPVLMEAKVQIFPVARCDRSYSTLDHYQATWPRGIGEETLCAGDPDGGGKDACQGDSGGPLVTEDDTGRYVLAGIVSRGYGCGHKDYPGLYANLRHPPYLAWVKKVAFGTP